MTASLALEKRFRRGLDHPIDYDASDAPVIAAGRVLGVTPRTHAQAAALFALVHWGYGSFVGTGQRAIQQRIRREPAATSLFYVAVQTMAFTLLPTLGGTPPPWRWRRDILVTSLVQHGVYAAATGSAAHFLRRRS